MKILTAGEGRGGIMKSSMTQKTAAILVVEDDVALNEAYRTILGSVGHKVVTAFNGREALDLLKSMAHEPEIILLDLRMPVLDGVGFLKEFRPLEHKDVTVVVFSNYDAHKDIDEAYELGVDRYVLKARAAPKDLLHLVDSIIEERRASSEQA